MDKSLDDIIKSKPRNHRRGGARVNALGTSAAGANPSTRARYAGAVPLANGASAVTPATQASDKIIVSNLPLDVNEAQIKELFSSTVGNLRDVNLHYDAHGKSKGVALVQFVKKGDGAKAYQQYNNRLIDGKRPMKIEIVLGPAAPPSLVNRVAPAAAPMEGVETTAGPTRTGRGGRGGRGRGRGRRNRGERTPKTAQELDTEMEDYTKTDQAGAAAPAAVTA